jgi:hypothetical protein
VTLAIHGRMAFPLAWKKMAQCKRVLLAAGAALGILLPAAAALGYFLLPAEVWRTDSGSVAVPEECDSCTLRHQSLGKSKEERAREDAELRALYEKSVNESKSASQSVQ